MFPRPFLVIAYISTSFLLWQIIFPCLAVPHFVHALSAGGNLRCFHFVMNNLVSSSTASGSRARGWWCCCVLGHPACLYSSLGPVGMDLTGVTLHLVLLFELSLASVTDLSWAPSSWAEVPAWGMTWRPFLGRAGGRMGSGGSFVAGVDWENPHPQEGRTDSGSRGGIPSISACVSPRLWLMRIVVVLPYS